jgi:YVTN family beta-propeller protein
MRPFIISAGLLALLAAEPGPSAEPHRSPCDLAVLPDGRRLLTANQTADSVSLVDVGARKVIAELRCGRKPSAVALSRDGKHGAVSSLWSGSITLFEVGNSSLNATGEISVGPIPRGLTFAPDGKTLYAAIAGADEVVRVDIDSGKVTNRWPAPREPYCIALSADGSRLAAASSRSGEVRLWDTGTGRLAWEQTLDEAFNLRGLVFAPDGQSVVCAQSVRRAFPVSRGNIEEGWAIDNRLTRLPVKPGPNPSAWQIALDPRGKAVGDPYGVAYVGNIMAVTGSGTHELLLFEAGHMPWRPGAPGDVLDVVLEVGPHPMRRVDLGGRPLAVAALGKGDEVAVVNSLLDAVQVVDVKAAKLTRTVPLGGPKQRSPARRGEALFYDAGRSHSQWFSCNTCHTEGHTCGLTFDTLNDDSYGNPKLTPSLRGVTKTGPWTWHGWQKDLGAGVAKSFTETMFGAKPTEDEIKAMLAFLATLEQPPNAHRKDEAAVRGERLFRGKAGCAHCHKGDEYTSEGTYDVGLEADGSPYEKWNPPSLRGLWDRGPYLHDARARTLEELVQEHHVPEKLGGETLTAAERKDLIAFLLSL